MNRREYELVGKIVDPHSIIIKDIHQLRSTTKAALISTVDFVVNLSPIEFKLKRETPQFKFYDIDEPGYDKQFVGLTAYRCSNEDDL